MTASNLRAGREEGGISTLRPPALRISLARRAMHVSDDIIVLNYARNKSDFPEDECTRGEPFLGYVDPREPALFSPK